MSNAADILKTMSKLPGSLEAMPPPASVKGGLQAGPANPNEFSKYLQKQLTLGAGAEPGATSGAEAGADPKAVDKDQAVRQAQAEKAAGDLVSNALILPMLKQLRRSPWGENTVFSAGMGEKAFGPQFDMQISDRIAHSPRLGIKKALTERIIKRGQPNATSSKPAKSPNANATGGLDVHG